MLRRTGGVAPIGWEVLKQTKQAPFKVWLASLAHSPGRSAEPIDRRPKLLLRAYRLHLFVPLFLLLDVLHAWSRQMARSTDLALGAFSAVWLLFGLSAIQILRNRQGFLDRVRGPLLAFYATCMALGMVELALQVLGRGPRPTLWTPGMHFVSQPNTSVLPGVSQVAHFRVNELGLRGPSLPSQNHVYRIVAVGGSTTLCLLLDDAATWPQQLMQEMNTRQDRVPVWVANAAVNGHTVVHHLTMLQSLPILGEVDLLIFLPGINDLQYTLSFEGGSTQDYLQRDADHHRETILNGAENPYPLYHRLRIYRLVRRASSAWVRRFGLHEAEVWDEVKLQKQRAGSPVVSLPDLSTGFQEYRGRLNRLAQECRQRGIRCIFLTQPSLWRQDLTSEERRLLLFGWVGSKSKPKGYLSVPDSMRSLDGFNRTLLEVCRQESLECFDLAAVVPKRTSAFYDDVHFNEGGARVVARTLADFLLNAPPFSAPGKGIEAAPASRGRARGG